MHRVSWIFITQWQPSLSLPRSSACQRPWLLGAQLQAWVHPRPLQVPGNPFCLCPPSMDMGRIGDLNSMHIERNQEEVHLSINWQEQK